MAIRMTGLTSGLDTESIVAALMEAQKTKKTKVENKKTKLEWTKEIWAGLNTKLTKFHTDFAGKLRLQANYKTKKASSSNASVLTATAKSSAANGSYSILVKQIATAQSVTSAKLGTYQTTNDEGELVDNDVTGKTKLKDLGFVTDGSSEIQVKTGKKTVNLYVDDTTTVGDFLKSMQNAGLNASFDEKQGRFFISSSSSGEKNAFEITSNTLSGSQQAAMSNLMAAMSYDTLTADQKSSVKSALSDLQNAQDDDAKAAAQKKLMEIADKNSETKATKYYKEQLTKEYTDKYIRVTTEQKKDKDGNLMFDDDGNPVMVEELTDEGRQALKDLKLDNDTYVDEDRIAVLKDKGISKKVAADIKKDEYKDKIKDAVENGLKDDSGNPVLDEDGNTLVEAKATRDSAIVLAVDNYATEMAAGVTLETNSSLKKLGLDNLDGSKVEENADGTGMAVVAAVDSIVQVNGATLKSDNTTLEVNGLTLDLVSASDSPVTLSVSNDTSAVYDMIKDFVNQYNSILADLNKYYHASSAKGYDPLTDEQKEAMSDDEVEKWETKIKNSLLRRDGILGGVIDTMRNSMTNFTVKASNGKTYSLANLGITTGKDYKEYGLLHIKGDEDDTVYADDKNTLQSLIDSDPDVVMEVLSGIVGNLYNSMSKKMSSTTMSSALTFYNDKEMDKQLSQYSKDIKAWETKLADMEDRYYKQFTAMEKALTKLQSQQSSLASYLGG